MKVYSLNEITDSKVLYDKKPPRFMVYIIFIVLFLIVGFLFWSTKSIKTYVVKGQGIVTTANKAFIMSKIQGEVKEVFVEEGKQINEGDVILTINSVQSNLQLEQVNGQVQVLDRRINLLKRAEEEATHWKNTFDKDNPEEVEFYNKLVNSYIKANEYKVDEAALKKQNYTDDQIKQYKEQAANKADQIYYDTILSFTTEKNQLELEKSKLQTQGDALQKSGEEYKLLASKSGVVHLNSQINKGLVLQAGTLLGSITNADEELVVEIMLPSSERPRIHNDDEVSIAVSGLNQAEYGTIPGKVLSIDKDATINNEKGEVYFKVKVKPDITTLKDKKGEEVNLTLGMLTETRVKYEKITYMKYFLEQIGVKFS
ncbi:HlyD family secretion protein [Clostridium cellulovorans]|uniref:Secretion protein HlyD family protein n=1 Tax=Clostridium cellulovorans (strain ATCC 35296 / DSM 3052 / OCM 3 / 743B) TaxID=573061 RepID=D9SSB6_CLOC7|nr:HlyD family efflux transporter periplasmic adaptor subunit [Clostridium cellulovorans]ADL50513.1 secretion protein HlyD family protein [Clostridium cellulovorans 743B]